jgi:hypothetical protein
MLDYIRHKNQIKEVTVFFPDVRKFELQFLVGSTFGQFVSPRKDVIPPEDTVTVLDSLEAA